MHTILEKENKWNKTNQWENELEQLHAIIRKTPLVETTKWGGPVYTRITIKMWWELAVLNPILEFGSITVFS